MEEDDYMSDALLAQIQQEEDKLKKRSNSGTSRPRKVTWDLKLLIFERKEPERLKPLKEREKESREEGLQVEIGEENKGFKMLKMMGYKLALE